MAIIEKERFTRLNVRCDYNLSFLILVISLFSFEGRISEICSLTEMPANWLRSRAENMHGAHKVYIYYLDQRDRAQHSCLVKL